MASIPGEVVPGVKDPFDQGVDDAAPDAGTAEGQNRLAVKAKVKRWFERIDRAREHDRVAYQQLAVDRAYARGDSSFQTKVNVIGSYIDTWTSLLYARDPDMDVMPADASSVDRIEDARHFSKALEIVIRKHWQRAKMKLNARQWVRAALTSQIGWLKVTWQERMGSDPISDQARADLQDQLEGIAAMTRKMRAEGKPTHEQDAEAEELRLAIKSLSESTEQLVYKGLCIDPVDMADITVSDEAPSIGRYLDSPWISHRTFMRLSAARGMCPDVTEEEWKKASFYSQKKPKLPSDESPALGTISHTDADSYQGYEGQTSGITVPVTGEGFVCFEEVWDRDTNQVFTLVRGLECYARAPFAPNPGSTRFYPFFGLTFTEVDGQRWAQSLNQRSQSLQEAFSRVTSAFEEHRKRIKPKTIFNAGAMADTEAKKLEGAVTGEMVGITPTNPKQDMRGLLATPQYPQLDPGLYDIGPIMHDFELIWGLQEAMTASIDTAKTATEAEIQQGGTQARTTDKRDRVEDELTEIAQYSAEIVVQKVTREEAVKMCGKSVLWIEGMDIDDLDQLVAVNIRAGSSGKPNTKAMRESWASTMPLIQGLVQQIAMLRQSNPLEIASKLEELVTETAARSGENIDPTRFIPQVGQPMQLIDPTTMQPVLAYPAPPEMQPAPPAGAPGLPPVPGDPAGPLVEAPPLIA